MKTYIDPPKDVIFLENPSALDVKSLFPKVSNRVKELFIQTFLDFLEEFPHFQYTLAYGTALGSMLYKDILPWDDDFDILAPRSQLQEFYDVIEKSDKLRYTHHTFKCIHSEAEREIGKLWSSNTELFTEHYIQHKSQVWGYPFVDICWLEEAGDYFKDTSNGIIYAKNDLFPSIKTNIRNYEFDLAPNAKDVIKQRHPLAFNWALSYNWDHLNREGNRRNKEAKAVTHSQIVQILNNHGYNYQFFRK